MYVRAMIRFYMKIKTSLTSTLSHLYMVYCPGCTKSETFWGQGMSALHMGTTSEFFFFREATNFVGAKVTMKL